MKQRKHKTYLFIFTLALCSLIGCITSALQVKAAEIVFKKTSETVYATVNVNIRSSYTTKEDNIVSVLKKGNSVKRIGINKEWSKVMFQNKIRYIKSSYLTLKKPNEAAEKEDFVSKLKISEELDQLIVVVGNGGADSTVSFHTKDFKGTWTQQFSIDGDNGSNGITYKKRDGDKKTPAGLFELTVAFGIKTDPGALLSFRQITKYDYWIDDLDSPYYNTWVNSKETPGNYKTEHLIDHNPSYNYAVNINSNPKNIPGNGSAIFLHCYNGTGRTTGCVAIAEKYMKSLIKQLDSSAKILIVPNADALKNY
jgi:L,D-peptidoglycan transpeptidase YkuD (ErfK/YbiS/YcfS/YnhG family)